MHALAERLVIVQRHRDEERHAMELLRRTGAQALSKDNFAHTMNFKPEVVNLESPNPKPLPLSPSPRQHECWTRFLSLSQTKKTKFSALTSRFLERNPDDGCRVQKDLGLGATCV